MHKSVGAGCPVIRGRRSLTLLREPMSLFSLNSVLRHDTHAFTHITPHTRSHNIYVLAGHCSVVDLLGDCHCGVLHWGPRGHRLHVQHRGGKYGEGRADPASSSFIAWAHVCKTSLHFRNEPSPLHLTHFFARCEDMIWVELIPFVLMVKSTPSNQITSPVHPPLKLLLRFSHPSPRLSLLCLLFDRMPKRFSSLEDIKQ